MACPVAPDEHWIMPSEAFDSLRQNPISKPCDNHYTFWRYLHIMQGLYVILEGPFRKNLPLTISSSFCYNTRSRY